MKGKLNEAGHCTKDLKEVWECRLFMENGIAGCDGCEYRKLKGLPSRDRKVKEGAK